MCLFCLSQSVSKIPDVKMVMIARWTHETTSILVFDNDNCYKLTYR